MQSIKQLYKIGQGPSSSHTIGPQKASQAFKTENSGASSFRVTLYGSLAATGKGHFTDKIILETFKPFTVEIVWNMEKSLPYHPNGMKFEALDEKGTTTVSQVVYSVGGGDLVYDGAPPEPTVLYPHHSMNTILEYLDQTGKKIWEYVFETDYDDLEPYLHTIWKAMKAAIKRGLTNDEVLPGPLHLPRKAASFQMKAKNAGGLIMHTNKLFSYALAVAEENASCGVVVTAPTCGSAGVMPSVLYHLSKFYHINEDMVIKALASAGLFGNLVKENASVSGAEVGCQGEIGTACAMAAAAAAQLLGGSPRQIEYAAEIALEHHLGLTCDPVQGLVQIPCIERNAMGAVRAVDCASYALSSDGRHSISFDKVVEAMKQTGLDLKSSYKETSRGGLAKYYRDKKNTISSSLKIDET